MKTYIPYSLLLAAAASGLAFGAETAYTTPVGYVTESLPAAQDNLIGLTVHQPVISAGILTAEDVGFVTAGTVTPATTTDFTALLGASSPPTTPTYILELEDGTIQVITSWSADGKLFTPDNITANVVPGTTTYKLRKAATITDIFGANSVGLSVSTDLTTTSADVLLVPDGAGGFNSFFYYDDGVDELWLNTALEDSGSFPLVYTDGIIVARKAGAPISLVVSGEVKTTQTNYVVAPGDNYLGAVYPVGSELAESGVGPQLNPSTDLTTTVADLLLFPDGAGGYSQYFYYDDGVDELWLNSALEDSAIQPYTSGFILSSKSVADKNLLFNTPEGYSTL